MNRIINHYGSFFLILSISVIIVTNNHSQTIPVYNIVRGDTSVSSGYYFFHSFKIGNSALGMRHMILDRKGELVYFKPFNFI